MAKIQLGTGSSSASSHRLTQSSQTLNRRYVGRPSNLAIDEAAQNLSTNSPAPSSAPSRLVNLRVHAADLQQLQAQNTMPEPVANANTSPTQIVPRVVEFGASTAEVAPTTAQNPSIDLNQIVPPEEIVDQPVYSEPPVQESMMMVATSVTSDAPNYHTPSSEVDTQTLAMSIAADYAAASFDASVNNEVVAYNSTPANDTSIDAIAQAASEAIAAIRTATDPEEVAEQVASLQAFANNIKASSAAPEMLELSDTIEKFVSVAMKSSKIQAEVEKKTKKTVKSSKPAVKVTPHATTPKAMPHPTTATKTATRPVARPSRPVSKLRPTSRRTKVTPKLVADEDQALRNALRSVADMDGEPSTSTKKTSKKVQKTGSGKRFVLAFICAAACVAAVVYFVGSNIPDISVKVAAMQTGIEASCPSYIPRDFSLSDISSENGKIILYYKGPDQAAFNLSEEKSSWDSTALLRNYVEPSWQDNYTTTHEQGVTVYISGANAAWVNGGILYKINSSTSNSLTKKQLRNIVTSL